MQRFCKYIIGVVAVIGFGLHIGYAQHKTNVVDKIVGVVGSDIVLKSTIDNQLAQMAASGMATSATDQCELVEESLYQKLLLNQAKLDSIVIPDAQIEMELDRRLRYFIAQFGSEEKMEAFYHKSILKIKEEFYDLIKDQLLAQQMQQTLTGGIELTPAEIRSYYESIPQDSIPYINSEVEIAHIVKIPQISDQEKMIARNKLEKLRTRVINGESFETLAILYSDDPGSAQNGGELGFMNRTDLVPEFSAVGFNLKPGETSEIVETQYGYHIIQLIERLGEKANLRHILVTVSLSPQALENSRNQLDSLKQVLESDDDTLTFAQAAKLYSDDKDSKFDGGVMSDPQSGITKFETQVLSAIDPQLPYAIDNMEVGDIIGPKIWQSPDGKQYFHIITLVSRSEPHMANLNDDYQRIKDAALLDKQYKEMNDWIDSKIESTFIKIESDYTKCQFRNNWLAGAE